MEQIAEECGVGLCRLRYDDTPYASECHGPSGDLHTWNQKGKWYITEYTMSEIIASIYDCMEQTGKKRGILFLDEINCVSETLAPVMLQLLQEKNSAISTSRMTG